MKGVLTMPFLNVFNISERFLDPIFMPIATDTYMPKKLFLSFYLVSLLCPILKDLREERLDIWKTYNFILGELAQLCQQQQRKLVEDWISFQFFAEVK